MSAAEYTAVGYLLINEACNRYFDRLIDDQNTNGLASDVTTATGTAVAAILGYAEASPGDIGRAATSFGLLGNILKSFRDRGLVTPYPTETKGLVMAALQAYERAAPASGVTTKERAATLIEGYAEVCSYSGVARLAKQALAAARPEASIGGGQTSKPVLDETGRQLATGLAASLGVELDDEQLALLYLYAVEDPNLYKTATAADALLKKLPKALSDKLKNGGARLDPLQVAEMSTPIALLKDIHRRNAGFKTLVAKVKSELPGASPQVEVDKPLEAVGSSESTGVPLVAVPPK